LAGDNITCTVLLFAKAAEVFGKRETQLALPVQSTGNDLFGVLSEQVPEFAQLKCTCAIAVNKTLCSFETPIEDKAVVAILPPVSGG
jgi:molybdopterin converting factor subunit 1